ncbi:glutamate synthase large subunit [Corynebacterium sputi]|uniref:glutamate synthase large subunit n=1 Tax=Corynebacterium sputi TaxID=489915 RepID=UPI00040384E2|nr:glutamate synthase large subunit [Corynebacterium sputi]
MLTTGLYDPAQEHDACGVAFVADIHGRPSRAIVDHAIRALVNLDHRGAAGAEDSTGDGAGILLQIPDTFYRTELSREGVLLPDAGEYATGIAFLPQSRMAVLDAIRAVEDICAEEGVEILAWRDVPIDASSLGSMAKDAMPQFRQVFMSAKDRKGKALSGIDLDRKVWFVRKRCERELGARGAGEGIGGDTVYFPSLSARTIVYKGMLTTPQLGKFYEDLQRPEMVSALAVVHSRFSTNTFPSWPLAHPYRMVAHNGEFNTVRGNENWMRAREALIRSEVLGSIDRVLPVCDPAGSDTARFDEALELLHLGGRSLPHSVLMMVPQAWEHDDTLSQEVKAFYEYHACLMEPWDGPAAVVFTDGTKIGAVLDRNGLRPGRIWVTDEGLVVMASEAGVLDIAPEQIVQRTRVEPGRMFMVDTEAGRIVEDEEIKAELAVTGPYEEWVRDGLIEMKDLPERRYSYMPHRRAVLRQRVFGITEEDVDLIIRPMALTGAEGIGSMGSDTPIAALSNRPRMLFDYFSQRFAQVTNPPLDSIREKSVTSMFTLLGAEADVLNPSAEAARKIRLKHPILDNHDLVTLIGLREEDEFRPDFKAVPISGLYPVAQGGRGLRNAINRVNREVQEAIGRGAKMIVLSDRESDEYQAPIPSLLLVSAVHHHLVETRNRSRVSLIVESGDAREVHHMAMLISFGADAINPYMAFETIDELRMKQQLGDLTLDEACDNYCNAAATGVLKVMSKMGIAAVQSYRGAQLADVLGLSQELLDHYFTGAVSPLGGVGLEEIAEAVESRHRSAFLPRPEEQAHRDLDLGGEYKWRREGEYHLFNPETIFRLQHATRTGSYEIFKDYANKVDDQTKRLATLRGLMEISNDCPSISLDEVEPVESIVKRFSTGAMSYGSISAEAHETLAIAMNRLGGMSNSGEGGEDPARFDADPNGDWRRSAIKQVASGRFGVSSHYLANCTDIQIKMAQGAKPGEGGQLPPNKVYPWIAEVRVTTPGVGLISPPPHHDIYSIEDLAQLIFDLKNANPKARIHVKLVSELGVGTVAAGVSKAHADVVLISGHDGGTGASPLTSLKHAGGPWELGLAETQQTLMMNGLRDRIRVQCDGQMKTGRDVMVAALLGAEEFGFATAPLVVEGCIMMRVCHLDTCPVGIATQNPELRARYQGQADHVVNFFVFIAEQVREYLADLGFRTLDEAIGQVDCLQQRADSHLDLSRILAQPETPFFPEQDPRCTTTQDHGLDGILDQQLIQEAKRYSGEPVTLEHTITNVDRSVGTQLGYEVTQLSGAEGLPDGSLDLRFTGSAGNSMGAFLPKGLQITLEGDANDFVGKGLSGGRIIVKPSRSAPPTADAASDVIAGNVIGFGATEGEIFLRGTVGERFLVRNSGCTAVVEGIGNHGCEYMTGGYAIVLGKVGRNFAAGMSGGIAYLLNDGTLEAKVNPELVDLQDLTEEETEWLDATIARHKEFTGSETTVTAADMRKVMPRDYARILKVIERAEEENTDVDTAIMEAVNNG